MKYFLSTDSSNGVHVLCIIREDGVVEVSKEFKDENLFIEEMNALAVFYGAIKVEEKEFDVKRYKHYRIPSISQAMADFLKTEKGKQVTLEFLHKNDCLDWELLEELRNFKNE